MAALALHEETVKYGNALIAMQAASSAINDHDIGKARAILARAILRAASKPQDEGGNAPH